MVECALIGIINNIAAFRCRQSKDSRHERTVEVPIGGVIGQCRLVRIEDLYGPVAVLRTEDGGLYHVRQGSYIEIPFSLLRWRKNTYVNLTRISAIRHPGRKCVVVLDDGTQFPVPSSGMRNLAAALRLETLHTLPGYTEPHMQMTRLGLRDWPFEIAAADSATLRAQF